VLFREFSNNENLDIVLKVIMKPLTKVIILHTTNAAGDYNLVIYNYTTDAVVLQKNWAAA